ncbi:hypothetical protein [Citrobacter sp. JGM124]|uniref:hypothetical protein n=1 Tax=Citrobacter sp. JGM124 TaxID=2799789 RepID=UPI001BA6564B|nr:hypothetical protein [Citrobacter sp. JGM124]MBS0846997.1 hypothetical protein [Citrobacter sp. JGM124]
MITGIIHPARKTDLFASEPAILSPQNYWQTAEQAKEECLQGIRLTLKSDVTTVEHHKAMCSGWPAHEPPFCAAITLKGHGSRLSLLMVATMKKAVTLSLPVWSRQPCMKKHLVLNTVRAEKHRDGNLLVRNTTQLNTFTARQSNKGPPLLAL